MCVCLHRHLKKNSFIKLRFQTGREWIFFLFSWKQGGNLFNKIKLIILNENLLIMSQDTKKAFQETDNKGLTKEIIRIFIKREYIAKKKKKKTTDKGPHPHF